MKLTDFSRGELLRERVCEASSRALQPSLFRGGSISTGASHATRANCLDVDVEQICNLPGQHRSIWPLGSVVPFSEANPRLVPDSVEPYPHAVVNLIATIHRLGSLFQKRDECQETQRSLADVGRLFQTIRRLVMNGDYVVGQHASERLEERGLQEWQAVVGMDEAGLIAEDESAIPNPKVEVSELLPDGTEFKAVWSLLRASGVAKLVTVHFFDEE